MNYFFRTQDNPYGDDDDGGESREETDDAKGSSDDENQSLQTAHGYGYYNRDPSDDDDGYDEDSGSGEMMVGSGQYASYLDRTEQLALSFDSQDAEDDAEYGDDSYGADEEDSSISKVASYQPQLPSLNSLMPAKSPSDVSKYELGYEDEAIVPVYGVFAIIAVVIWYIMRRCCSRGNGRKKLRSNNAKISYHVAPKFRPEMTIV